MISLKVMETSFWPLYMLDGAQNEGQRHEQCTEVNMELTFGQTVDNIWVEVK